MTRLSQRDKELVALGAAVGSNCVPCVVFHIKEARDCGLSDENILEAVESADKLKQVPAGLVLNAAYQEVGGAPAEPNDRGRTRDGCGCQTRA
jgi:4-carboxymuconolactone decarboxylase